MAAPDMSVHYDTTPFPSSHTDPSLAPPRPELAVDPSGQSYDPHADYYAPRSVDAYAQHHHASFFSPNEPSAPSPYYARSPIPDAASPSEHVRSSSYDPASWQDPHPLASSQRHSSFFAPERHVRQSSSMSDMPSPNIDNGSTRSLRPPNGAANSNLRNSTISTRSLSGGPFLDNSHLKPGTRASLLSHNQTLELYRANIKKTNDPSISYEFAIFMLTVAREAKDGSRDSESVHSHSTGPHDSAEGFKRDSSVSSKDKELKANSPQALVSEATALLSRLANRGHVPSALLLADLYTQGNVSSDRKKDRKKATKAEYDKAFPLFVLAAKHGDPEGCFRAGECCEKGWGTKKDIGRAVQFYNKSASQSHPDAMYRLGLLELNSDSRTTHQTKDGVKWLKRCAALVEEMENSGSEVPSTSILALHELALLHERGLEHIVFVDIEYAVELLAKAAELGNANSAMKLGDSYERGKMGCPKNAALSIHYYNIAAQQGIPEGCYALTAWYLVGAPGCLPQSDTEAYLWALRAAEKGLPKACFLVGHFFEEGRGTYADESEATRWYTRAAELGDTRATHKLKQRGLPVPPRIVSDNSSDKVKLRKSQNSDDQDDLDRDTEARREKKGFLNKLF